MSIKKKNRRKKRKPQKVEPLPTDTQEKATYQDDFQSNVGNKIEEFGAKFEGKGKNILYGLAAIAVLAILVGIFYTWNRRTNNAAQAALGKAIETSNATVSEAPVPAGATYQTFKTAKDRAQAAITEFQSVVDSYGSPYREKAQYFIAASRLRFDRSTAIKEFEALSSGTGEVGILSKFALAQLKNDDGKLDESVKFYQELSLLDNAIISKETINFELAKIYEKQDKTKEAIELYFSIANSANEAKDSEGKPMPQTQTAREARERLDELAPEKAKEIKVPETPFPGLPLNIN